MYEPSADSKSDLISSLHKDTNRTAFGRFSSNPDFNPVQGRLSERYFKIFYDISDNQKACRIILVGSKKKEPLKIAYYRQL